MTLPGQIRRVLGFDPVARAVEFHEKWYAWGELAEVAAGVERELQKAGVGEGAAVGMLLRNHPAIVGAMLSVLSTKRCIVTINPLQGVEKLAADLRGLRTEAIIARPEDWAKPEIAAVASEVGALAIEVEIDPAPGCRVLRGREAGAEPHPALPGVAVEMLTSGTTGPPKRVHLHYRSIEQSLLGAAHYESGRGRHEAPVLKPGAVIVAAPLVHVSGMWRVLQAVVDGRSICLLERFEVEAWRAAVRRHRPKVASLVPTALRMILDADLPREELASLRAVTSGTAPLPPETAVAFEEKYGIPVLTLYGATEFAGGVAGWTLEDHKQWSASKRGSVGRPHPGCQLRVVDADDGRVLPEGSTGLLEVRTAQMGPDADWVRTTDLASIDSDGFLWIKGRADDAILRGGFKISPAEVVEVLERHPAVREAAVVGLPDPRLGAVPVAAVELDPDAEPLDPEALQEFARRHLARYQVPARILVVASLPRTPSLKVSQPHVRALFEEADPSPQRPS